ncbi:hypothetical protein B0H11DRAFT_2189652 [Mycena galericulata]|nr:hypothetical protein B0H11DRAFT_2189652 [Mycena galericulata]
MMGIVNTGYRESEKFPQKETPKLTIFLHELGLSAWLSLLIPPTMLRESTRALTRAARERDGCAAAGSAVRSVSISAEQTSDFPLPSCPLTSHAVTRRRPGRDDPPAVPRRERHRRWPPGLVPEVFDSVAKILGRLWPGYAAAAALSLVLSIDARHNVNSYQFSRQCCEEHSRLAPSHRESVFVVVSLS